MQQWKEPAMLTFIKLYKERDCLWTRQNYENARRSRATAWCEIAKQMSELNKQLVTPMDCKQKMKCLWQKFRREKLKVMSGKGEDVISNWSLYGELAFLENTIVSLLKPKTMTSVPMLRPRRMTRMIQRYAKPATNGALNKESETNILATPIGETTQTARWTRNSFGTKRKRRVTEDIGRTLKGAKIVKLNTTNDETYNLTTPTKRVELKQIKKSSKAPKYVNVNIIHSSTPEVHHSPVPPVSTPLDSCHTVAQDECQCFGMYVANKSRTYSACTRSAVQHSISDILFKADTGYYDRVNSSATVNTQTEATQSNVQQWPDTMQLSYVVKSEELSDLDDDSIPH